MKHNYLIQLDLLLYIKIKVVSFRRVISTCVPFKTHPRLLPVAEHLPECHAKHPAITGMRELSQLETFRGTPIQTHTT